MNALERSRGLGYLAVDAGAGYTEEKPHRGIDIKALAGDPIMIGSTIIGLTGATGKADGPHVHVQAGRDEWAQKTINPAPYIGKPGKVVKVGIAPEWGRYVCIQVGDVYVFYCHMSAQTVSEGKVIDGGDMAASQDKVDDLTVRLGYNIGMFRQPSDEEIRHWVDLGVTVEQFLRAVLVSKEHEDIGQAASTGEFEQLNQTVYVKKTR